MKPSHDPSVKNEPHLVKSKFVVDPEDAPLGLDRHLPGQQSNQDVEHTVWDEPALGVELAPEVPGDALTYAGWLDEREADWSQSQAWLATFAVALCAGPWALLTVLIYGLNIGYAAVVVTFFFGPLVQEIAKMALPLWIVEKRPFVFTSWFQIFLCMLASATCFAAVFILAGSLFKEVSEAERVFQWTAFLLMHVVTGTLSAFGLERIWQISTTNRTAPRLEHGYRWFLSAFIVHVVFTILVYGFAFAQSLAFGPR